MRRRYSGSQKGQSLVEFSLVLPVILVMVLGMVELGFAISHNTTIETATRQGARVGSQLVNGGGTLGCGTGQSPNWTTVDQQIIAAVEGVLVSPGSPVDRTQVQSIKIFLPDASTGAMTATLETWIPGTGPTLPGASSALHFKRDSGNWILSWLEIPVTSPSAITANWPCALWPAKDDGERWPNWRATCIGSKAADASEWRMSC